MIHDNSKSKNRYLVPAVDQAVRIMLCLAEGRSTPKSLTDICQEVGIHRSKAFSILDTLNEYDLVKKFPNRKGYVPGPGLLTMAGKMLENLNISHIAEPILRDLARQVGATATLGIISDDKTFVVAEYEGAPGIGISSRIGYVTPITYGSHGKVIAAFLAEEDLLKMLAAPPLYFYGNPANFDEIRLKRELEQCRQDGFAMELGDVAPGVNAVAAPMLDQSDKPVGYLTIVGFFSEEDAPKLGPLVVEASKAISKEIGHTIFWQKTNGRN